MTINRTYLKDCTTGIGVAELNGRSVQFRTIELPWRGNQRRISCIPEGEYTVISHTSPKFGRTFWLQNVSGRSEILVHVGNFTRDLLGCIAPGEAHKDIDKDGIMDVTNSRKMMNALLSLLWGKPFKLKIVSDTGVPK
jgi:hypothetical protein